ncbi:MAG: magnesium and cobalt transport protein CorA, partial [Candidatus Schekmanbacteria bacterium RBG_16_38_11]
VIDYDETNFQEREIKLIEECFSFKDKPTITWINVEGIHRTDIIQKLGDCYGFHPLVLEDILNTDQRPKIEDYKDYIYIVLKMLSNNKSPEIIVEQVSLILGPNFVISFQEGVAGDVFNPVRERIRNGKGRIRSMGADYLAYSLVDSIVDNYFIILEKLGERIEDLEEELLINPSKETLHKIHQLKREMIFLRKAVWPLREVISAMERGDSALTKEYIRVYFRDVYDHTIQIIDVIETYRDMLAGMLDIYLSSISNKMNEIMKFLTIIGTIFIPLTFIVGVYGMNFEFMPELRWHWGYFSILFFMLVVSVFMLLYFKRKKWL